MIAKTYLSMQAKPETVEKVCEIVKKQLALPADSTVTGESKFSALGADSLDTVLRYYAYMFYVYLPTSYIFALLCQSAV